jgi:hypothetical protein
MTEHGLATALERLSPVDLFELEARAALLARRDRKYLLPLDDAERLVGLLAPSARVLTIDGLREFRYESIYFDTPDLVSYLAAARRRPRRFKVRTRSYLDSGRCLLEIKTRDARGHTVKQRLEYQLALRDELSAFGRVFVASCPLVGAEGSGLEPVLGVRYVRSTLLLAEDARVTIDVGLRSGTADGRSVAVPGMAVVETKARGGPSEADRLLWAIGHRPIRVSKFCTSLAALDPSLPANRWTRALRYPWVVAASSRSRSMPEVPALAS